MHLARPGHAPNRRSFEVHSRRPKRRQIVARDRGRANLGQHGEQGVLVGRGRVHDLEAEWRVGGGEVDDQTGADLARVVDLDARGAVATGASTPYASSLFSTRAGGSRYTLSGNHTMKLVAGLDSKRDVGACELVRILDGGAAIFRVGRMTSRVEPGTQPGAPGVFTYVELDLLEPWVEGTSERVVARVDGGQLPSGEVSTSSVSISRGEVLGILLYAPRPENLGYPQMDSLGVFRPNGLGGYTNGQLFVEDRRSLSEIGALLRDVR